MPLAVSFKPTPLVVVALVVMLTAFPAVVLAEVILSIDAAPVVEVPVIFTKFPV